LKIDRLLGITIYLLNRKKANAQELAERFEVSVRTILRDIDCLCMAGIPVISTYGIDGGYQIHDSFKLERQLAGADDYAYIVSALKGLASAYQSRNLNAALQKLEAISEGIPTKLILDLGALSKKNNLSYKLSQLEQALRERHIVSFTYTNADNQKKSYEVEPIATMYKWYSWYLLSYAPISKDYRTFKLDRIEQLHITDRANSMEHDAELAKERWEKQADRRKYLHIKLSCKSEIRMKCLEYLNGTIESEQENGDFIFTFSVPENELFWYGVLLSFGNKAKVLEPPELRRRICSTCKDILLEYNEE
jgi:predicted DNA-binding transcriptional regulator YafY